jgi:hypothetical protein
MDMWTIHRSSDTKRLIIMCGNETVDVVETTVQDAVTVAWAHAHHRAGWTGRAAILHVDPNLRDI